MVLRNSVVLAPKKDFYTVRKIFTPGMLMKWKITCSLCNAEISYDKQDISWDLIESNDDAAGDLPNLEVKKI